jgi:predicted small metal-binding protein
MPDDKEVRCECGYEVTLTEEAELITDIRRHLREAHGIAFSVEDALLVVLRSQLELSRDSLEIHLPDLRMSEEGSP